MNASRHLLPVLGLLLVTQWATAQINDTLPAVVEPQVDNNRVKFTSQLRPLRGVAGAPAPFTPISGSLGMVLTALKKSPFICTRIPGDYPVRLWATNNYDDGKSRPPASKRSG